MCVAWPSTFFFRDVGIILTANVAIIGSDDWYLWSYVSYQGDSLSNFPFHCPRSITANNSCFCIKLLMQLNISLPVALLTYEWVLFKRFTKPIMNKHKQRSQSWNIMIHLAAVKTHQIFSVYCSSNTHVTMSFAQGLISNSPIVWASPLRVM